ncbi:MAG: phosphate acyltransferase PlsX [Phycisphaerae bacterium]
MRIGIDAMGGDRAPLEEVRGALAARDLITDGDRIVLVGDEKQILAHLDGSADWQDFIEVRHASEAIGMNESPVEALRAKPDSSIAVLAQMHRNGDVEATISAGNTGACVAAAQMRLRRLPGVHRPGIAIITPTPAGPVAVCDVGANVNCRPLHLQQYAVMSSLYLKAATDVKDPRVGLLSVGEEETKGNELVKKTRELLSADKSVNFIGNVESRDLFTGACDVMVCEGFVGNVVLKLMEGMATGVILGMIRELGRMLPSLGLGGGEEFLKKAAQTFMGKYDFNEYGGAPLLGISGICIICHGASDQRGIKNAVLSAKKFAEHQVNEQIIQQLSEGRE